MKKLLFAILALCALLPVSTSCNKVKTHIQQVKDHDKAVTKFMKDSGFVVLNKFPSDGVFGPKQFVRDTLTGVYYNIMDYGDRTRHLAVGKNVYIRFTGLYYFRDVTADKVVKFSSDNLYPDGQPIIYEFGNTNSYIVSAWAVPFRFIGHGAHVKMLVPYNAGFQSDVSKYEPTFYENIVYRIEK